jgi:hypothetical protein
MKNVKFMLAAAGSALIFSLSPIAFAQHSPGLVRVDLSGVATNLAQDLRVEVRQIPTTVEIPARVAASVCKVKEDTLGGAQGGSCTAETTNTELEQIVYGQIKGTTR